MPRTWTEDELEEFYGAERRIMDNPLAVHKMYEAQDLDLSRIRDYRAYGVGTSSRQYRAGLLRSIRARRELAETVGLEGMG
jgi:hypothetical protein